MINLSLYGLSGWLKNSFIDYPNLISSVLFFSNCNLRCPYCHNKDFITKQNDISYLSSTISEYFVKRIGLIDGIVFSGGEPTLHTSIYDDRNKLKDIGYKVKLDTNGLLPDSIKRFSPDYLALDIKTIPIDYITFKTTYNDVDSRIKESIDIVRSMGDNAEIRITVAPKIVNTYIISQLKSLLEGVSKVYLQRVCLDREVINKNFFNDTELHTYYEIQQYQAILSEVVEHCYIR